MLFPKMIDIERRSQPAAAWDFPAELGRQFAQERILQNLKPEARIAVAVGSRGISHLREIVAAVIQVLRNAGAQPYIVPAMGSHGGGTPAGQSLVLSEYGITPESMGVPIDDRMDVRLIGKSENGVDVFFSEAALQADGIVVVNRVKPHTDFSGTLGSGILKMITIGLGKHRGAIAAHAAASRLGYEAVIRAIARVGIRETPILCGVAIVEGQNHETAHIRVLRRESIEREEAQLLVLARDLMPKLPFDEVDLLVIDQMGKDVSGTGMDTNVIGRATAGYTSSLIPGDGPKPRISRIFVRGLTHATNGNAVGIGLADFTTTRAVETINRQAMYVNSLTALQPSCAKIPIYFDTDRECIERALASLALPESVAPRIVHISNTLAVDKLRVSEAYEKEISAQPALAVARGAHAWEFDSGDNLIPL